MPGSSTRRSPSSRRITVASSPASASAASARPAGRRTRVRSSPEGSGGGGGEQEDRGVGRAEEGQPRRDGERRGEMRAPPSPGRGQRDERGAALGMGGQRLRLVPEAADRGAEAEMGAQHLDPGIGQPGGDAQRRLHRRHRFQQLAPQPHQRGAGQRAGVAVEKAAEDGGLAPRADRRAVALGAARGEAGHHLGTAHQQVVQGVVQLVDLGAQGGEVGRYGRRCRVGRWLASAFPVRRVA
jgi:hypothetical protein